MDREINVLQYLHTRSQIYLNIQYHQIIRMLLTWKENRKKKLKKVKKKQIRKEIDLENTKELKNIIFLSFFFKTYMYS